MKLILTKLTFCGWILGFKQKVSFERTTIEKNLNIKQIEVSDRLLE